MTSFDPTTLRSELNRAVDVLDPAPPAFASILARAAGRRRRRRIAEGFSVVAVPAAVAVIVIAAMSITPSSTTQVRTGAPSRASLVNYARAHGGHRVGGPFAGASTSYGAYSTKRGLVVVDYNHSHWHQDGPAINSIEPSGGVLKIAHGPVLTDPESTPSIWVKIAGGDVSYFGVVLHRTSGRWRLAKFGTCGHHKLCYGGSNEQSYGHPTGGKGFASVQNNCTPDCAGGTQYRIQWRWTPAKGRFAATSVHRVTA